MSQSNQTSDNEKFWSLIEKDEYKQKKAVDFEYRVVKTIAEHFALNLHGDRTLASIDERMEEQGFALPMYLEARELYGMNSLDFFQLSTNFKKSRVYTAFEEVLETRPSMGSDYTGMVFNGQRRGLFIIHDVPNRILEHSEVKLIAHVKELERWVCIEQFRNKKTKQGLLYSIWNPDEE